MKLTKSDRMAIYCGVISTIIGLLAFTLSWNMWEYWNGPLPGYQLFLFPGNLSLIYFWHPIFTEEVHFWPKLFMLLVGQFVLTATFVLIVNKAISKFRAKAL